MESVTVSSKFQVVIPKAVRLQTGIEVGQTLQVIPYKDRLEMIPVRDMRTRRGFLKGMDTKIQREGDRV